jgi:hypothetical protein
MRTAQQAAVVDSGSTRRTRERLAPRLEDANERAGIEVWCGAILSEVREADAIESRANDQAHVVRDERTIHLNGQRLLASSELPAIVLVTAVAEVEAGVLQQIARAAGSHRAFGSAHGRYRKLTQP